MSRIYLLMYLCVWSATELCAQQQVFYNDTQETTLHYSFQNIQGSSTKAIRNMLRFVAPETYKKTHYEIKYTSAVRGLKNQRSGQRLDWELQLKNLEILDVPNYKGFSFADLFVPETVSFDVHVHSQGQQLVKKQYDRLALKKGVMKPERWTFQDTFPQAQYTVTFEQVYFHYSQAQVQTVKKRVQDVEGYIQAAKDVRAMHKDLELLQLEQVRTQDVEAIQQKMQAMDKQYALVKGAGFWQTLNLHRKKSADPRKLKKKCQNFETLFTHKRNLFNDMLANIHLLYMEEATVLQRQGQLAPARIALEKAIEHQPNFSPAHLQLTRLDYQQGALRAAGIRIQTLLNNYPKTPAVQQEATQLCLDIIEAYRQEMRVAIDQKNYTEALAQVAEVKNLALHTEFVQFDAREVEAMRQAVLAADFNDRLSQVQDSYQRQSYDEALAQVDYLWNFQQSERIQVDFDTELLQQRIIQAKFDDMYAEVQQLIVQRDFAQAATRVNVLKQFTNSRSAIFSPTKRIADLEQKIYLTQFDLAFDQLENRILMTRRRLNEKNFAQAQKENTRGFELLTELHNLANKYPQFIRAEPNLTRATQKVQAQQYRLEYLRSEDLLAQQRLDEALDNANKALEYQTQYTINLEAENLKPADELLEKIQLARYQKFIAAGDRLKKNGQDQAAIDQYIEADVIDRRYDFSGQGKAAAVGDKIDDAAQMGILQDATNAQKLANNTELETRLKELRQRAATYQLTQNPRVQAAFESLEAKRCKNAYAFEYAPQIAKIQQAVANNDFVQAQSLLENVRALHRRYNTCQNLQSPWLDTAQLRIEKVAKYQTLDTKGKLALRARSYAQAITAFSQAQNYHKTTPLVQQSIPTPPTLYDRFSQSEDLGFTYYGAVYLEQDMQAPEQAMTLLQRCLSHGYPASRTRPLQELLGTWAAQRDFRATASWKDATEVYTRGDNKTWKYFRRSFKKTWKRQ